MARLPELSVTEPPVHLSTAGRRAVLLSAMCAGVRHGGTCAIYSFQVADEDIGTERKGSGLSKAV